MGTETKMEMETTYWDTSFVHAERKLREAEVQEAAWLHPTGLV